MDGSVTPGDSLHRPRATLAGRFAWGAGLLAGGAALLIIAAAWWHIDALHHESEAALIQRETQMRAAQAGEALMRVQQRLAEIADSPLLSTALTDSLGRDAYLVPYLHGIQLIHAVPTGLVMVDFEGKRVADNGRSALSEAERARLLAAYRQGQGGALLSLEGSAPSVLLNELVRYPRSATIEGALWAKLPLASLLPVADYALAPVDVPAAPGRVVQPVPLPPALANLKLWVHGPVPQVQHFGDPGLALTGGLFAALLGGIVALAGRAIGRRLTSDLTALDRFATMLAAQPDAGQVADPGAAPRRARVSPRSAMEVAGLADSVNRMLDRLEEQSRSQMRLLATCIEHLNDTVMITEATPRPGEGHPIVFVNSAFERMTGYSREEVIGRTPKLLQGPDTDRSELKRVGEALAAWRGVRAEVLNYTRDGRRFWVEMDIVPVTDEHGWVTHWVSVERDVTGRREAEAQRIDLERQVRESQKMEAIGTLAGGIAHDFNNILAAILGNVTLARDSLPAEHPARERLDQIGRSSDRARALVQQILAYSRRQRPQRAVLDLRTLVQEAVAMLRATVPARVTLRVSVPDTPVAVTGDATELSQVLMNLGTNAWQALRDGQGVITFGLDVRAPDAEPESARHPGPPWRAAYAHLWVADDGMGMDTATQRRVFEPFFTTKPVGSGTGLGLSVVQGIVRSHGGLILLDSAPGEGTVFHVRLPLCDEEPGSAPEPVLPMRARGHGEHVLYVDDDEVLGTVAQALLQHWGYRVTAVRDAREALQVLNDDAARFDVVVTDFNMPGLSGLDVLREARRLRGDLPVILTSGYIEESVRAAALAGGAMAVVRKERLQDELPASVADALTRPAAPDTPVPPVPPAQPGMD